MIGGSQLDRFMSARRRMHVFTDVAVRLVFAGHGGEQGHVSVSTELYVWSKHAGRSLRAKIRREQPRCSLLDFEFEKRFVFEKPLQHIPREGLSDAGRRAGIDQIADLQREIF